MTILDDMRKGAVTIKLTPDGVALARQAKVWPRYVLGYPAVELQDIEAVGEIVDVFEDSVSVKVNPKHAKTMEWAIANDAIRLAFELEPATGVVTQAWIVNRDGMYE